MKTNENIDEAIQIVKDSVSAMKFHGDGDYNHRVPLEVAEILVEEILRLRRATINDAYERGAQAGAGWQREFDAQQALENEGKYT